MAEVDASITIEGPAGNLRAHQGCPSQIEAISIDISPALIKGVGENLPNAQASFDKFHVIAHASEPIGETRRLEQKVDPSIEGLRRARLKDRRAVRGAQRQEVDALLVKMTTICTAGAWHYRDCCGRY